MSLLHRIRHDKDRVDKQIAEIRNRLEQGASDREYLETKLEHLTSYSRRLAEKMRKQWH